ncbi:MAG: hypothetical protein LPK80_05440 [Bacteroidota bacterium]|nr:hypothetical protein [Bacteroidota bacterium]MDX5447937.1 hypothetical protein [Bacteroidota bacterium]
MGGEGSMMHTIKSLQFNRNQLKKVRFRRWTSPERKTIRIVREQIGEPHSLSESEKQAIRSKIKREITVHQTKVLSVFVLTVSGVYLIIRYLFY